LLDQVAALLVDFVVGLVEAAALGGAFSFQAAQQALAGQLVGQGGAGAAVALGFADVAVQGF
jgi:hypothetical protein